ncbi:MAG: ABC transporter permease [Hyphomicrobiaceae bacterium]|nr:ABC transporter permease [Hyphomicrobiaceae bacterium]MCC0023685.1 ABC transporter permease [Hyphomicrobiaceae bacterium]
MRLHRATPIVPQNSVAGRTLMLLIAIMTFLSCITLGGVILVQKSAIAWSSDVGREVTIQIRPIDGQDMDSNLRASKSIAEAIPGVGNVRVLSAEESGKLLEPWLGAGLDLTVLDIPRMIAVELSDPREFDADQLAENLSTIKGASLDTHSAWRQQLNAMSGTMVLTGVLVLLLIIVATILAVVFATRGTMASNRTIVDVLHFIGASNAFIAGEFQDRFLNLGLRGGAAGGLGAIVFFIIVGTVSTNYLPSEAGSQLSAFFGRFSLGWDGLLLLILVVPIIAGLTALTSRMTVRRFLTQIS